MEAVVDFLTRSWRGKRKEPPKNPEDYESVTVPSYALNPNTGEATGYADRGQGFSSPVFGAVDRPFPSKWFPAKQVMVPKQHPPRQATTYVKAPADQWTKEYVWHAQAQANANAYATRPTRY